MWGPALLLPRPGVLMCRWVTHSVLTNCTSMSKPFHFPSPPLCWFESSSHAPLSYHPCAGPALSLWLVDGYVCLGLYSHGVQVQFQLTLADGCFPFGAWEVLIASCEGYTSGCFCAQGKGMPCHSLSSSSCCLAVGGIGMEPCRHSGICWPWQAAWVSPVTSFCFIYGAHSPPPYQSVAVLSQGKPFDLCGVQLCCCQGQVFSFVAPWTCLGVHSHGRYRVHFFVHHHPVTN